MKYFLSIFTLFIFACQVAPQTMPTTHAPPAVAKLNITTLTGGGTCTVSQAATGLLSTAGHCCSPDATYTYGPNDRTATVVLDDDVHDICILRGEIGRPLVIAPGDPALGEQVWYAGYPLGLFLVSQGIWSGRSEIEGYTYGVCSTPVAGGASGSSVLNEKGEVVGILVASMVKLSSMTLVTPVEFLRDDVAKALKL